MRCCGVRPRRSGVVWRVVVEDGRLSLEAARTMGRLRVEGDQALIVAFGQWFKGA
jgi:hypothetical protein